MSGMARRYTGAATVVRRRRHHGETHHAAVVDSIGRHLGDRELATTAVGYRAMLAWIRGFGALIAVGVDGLGADGESGQGADGSRSDRDRSRSTRPKARRQQGKSARSMRIAPRPPSLFWPVIAEITGRDRDSIRRPATTCCSAVKAQDAGDQPDPAHS